MKQLVEFIVKSIVTNKDAVEVREVEQEEEMILEIVVDSNDLGKIIGKNGKIAQAIRTIVKTASVGMSKKYFVKILDN